MSRPEWRSKLPVLNEPETLSVKCPKVRYYDKGSGGYVYEPQCRPPVKDQCHCTVEGCHRTFRWVTHFDLHRFNGQCLDPGGLGLHQVEGLWDTAEGHMKAQAAGERLKNTRSKGAVTTTDAR